MHRVAANTVDAVIVRYMDDGLHGERYASYPEPLGGALVDEVQSKQRDAVLSPDNASVDGLGRREYFVAAEVDRNAATRMPGHGGAELELQADHEPLLGVHVRLQEQVRGLGGRPAPSASGEVGKIHGSGFPRRTDLARRQQHALLRARPEFVAIVPRLRLQQRDTSTPREQVVLERPEQPQTAERATRVPGPASCRPLSCDDTQLGAVLEGKNDRVRPEPKDRIEALREPPGIPRLGDHDVETVVLGEPHEPREGPLLAESGVLVDAARFVAENVDEDAPERAAQLVGGRCAQHGVHRVHELPAGGQDFHPRRKRSELAQVLGHVGLCERRGDPRGEHRLLDRTGER